MEPFLAITGIAAPLMRDHVDTDAIFPAHYIQSLDVDYGAALFGNWRYVDGGPAENPDFVLNRPPFREARILVARHNFGCGSSREHAVWALAGFGIRCVIAESFGDILRDNCLKNGILPVALPMETVEGLAAALEAAADPRLAVDLERQVVVAPGGRTIPFEIDPGRRIQLMQGLDDIGATLLEEGAIARFQAADRVRRPWAWPADTTAA